MSGAGDSSDVTRAAKSTTTSLLQKGHPRGKKGHTTSVVY